MYVLIIGGGEIGRHVARILVEDGHDVAVVELDRDLAARLDASLDALVVQGSGIDPGALRRAGIDRADLFLAVTSIDEVNLIACMTARKYGRDGLRVLARVRQSHDVAGELALSAEDLGLDALISPQQSVTSTAVENLRYTGSGEIRELAGGRLLLVGMNLAADSPLVHESIEDLRRDYADEFLVAGVHGAEPRVASGSDRLRPEDRPYVLTRPRYLTELAILSGMPWYRVHRILIVGCGITGLTLARELGSLGYEITIVEQSRDRAQSVATRLPGALVLHGDGTEPDFLMRHIEERRVDAAVVLLSEPEKAILVGIFAASLGARKVIVRCDKLAYAQLARKQGVDVVISPKAAMSEAIQRHVRRGCTEATLQLGDQQVQLVRFRIPEQPRRPAILHEPLDAWRLPEQVLPAALIRGSETFIGPSRMILEPGDELLLTSPQQAISTLETLLA
jgi:trk system potassium uptake protein